MSEHDPLDALRLPQPGESPRPEFAAALRRRIETAFDPHPGGIVMATHPPAGRMHHVTPYLCAHDARAAIDWYQEYFGARLNGEPMSMDGSPFGPGKAVGHCELWFGDSIVYLSDEWPEGGVLSPKTRRGTANSFVLEVPTPADVDVVFDRAVANGAVSMRPVAEQFYGARAGQLTDPFGYSWSISSPTGDANGGAADPPTGAARDAGVSTLEATRGTTFYAFQPWNEVGYFTVEVSDLGRARAFYGRLFDWDLPAADGPYLHNPSTQLPMGFATEGKAPGTPTLYYRVRAIEPLLAKVRELGGEILNTGVSESGPNAVCLDNQGIEFQLWQPAEGY